MNRKEHDRRTPCLERKITLSGEEHLYACTLLSLTEDAGILHYVLDRNYEVNGILLKPGDETFALFWRDRPYTLYIWHLFSRPVFYFNIADRIELTPREFVWRDLVIDILVAEDRVFVLDEQELPAGLSPSLRSYIAAAAEQVTLSYRKIGEEAVQLIARLPLSRP